ncbi:MAG: ABC transporter permease [Candidatus Altiarchaeota archaeon]|nr:ABC transporter permease [Candidatus Altiarchaeota archaeon]
MIDVALKNVFRQRVRSGLTILGIAIGIGLILALGAIGEGLNKQIRESFGDIAGVIDVRADFENDEGISDDVIEGIKKIDGVTSVVPVGEYQIRRGSRGMGGMMFRFGGVGGASMTFTGIFPEDQDYLIGEHIIAEEGRKLDESDDREYVVVLGSTTAENQYLNLGDEIEYERREDGEDEEIESYYFEVIGILEETGDSSIDEAAFVLLRTMQELEDDETITSLKVRISDVELVETITEDINYYSDEVMASSPLSMVRNMESTLSTLQMAVYGIAAISLLVGGIGVMNTMIMSVMERRREIGVMKAIGATTTTILIQVLEESAFLSGIGGLTGLMLGYASTGIITQYTTFTTILTPELISLGLGFSVILGMGAGLYPAWSASQLDPIEVLRYE